MKRVFGVAFLIAGLLSSTSFASQVANVTVERVRFWSDSDVIYLALGGGSNLNPAGCTSSGFWELRAATEDAKKRMYAMALMAKATANSVRVEIHDSVCSGAGTTGYPTVWMMELE